MAKKCPDCSGTSGLHTDSASTFWEVLLKSTGVLSVKRCSDCNALVYVILGCFATSRRKMHKFMEGSFWIAFVLLLLATGYVVFETIID